MEIINVKKSGIESTIAKALANNVGTDWDIYVNVDGDLAILHNAYDNDGWYEVIDLYDANFENDGKYPGDDGYDHDLAAEWIVNELNGWLPDTVEVDGKNYYLELTD